MTLPVQEGSPTRRSAPPRPAVAVLPAATASAPPFPNATMPSRVMPGDVVQAAPAATASLNAGVHHASQIEADIQETQEANRVAAQLGGGNHMEILDGRPGSLGAVTDATHPPGVGITAQQGMMAPQILDGRSDAGPGATTNSYGAMAANTTTPEQPVPSPTLQELQERQLSLDAQQRELQRQLQHATFQSQQALVPPHGNNPPAPAVDGDYLHQVQQQHQQSLLQQQQEQQQQQQQQHAVVSTTDECHLTSAVQSPEHTADRSAFIAPGSGPGPAADSAAANLSTSALLSSQCLPKGGLQSLQTFAPTPQSETQPQAQQQQRQSGAGLSQSTFITAGSSGSMHGHSGVLQGSMSLSNNTAMAANGLPVMTGLQQQQLQQQQQGALNTNPLLSASLGAHQAPHIAPPGSQPGLPGASVPGLTALPQLPSHQQGALSGLHQAPLPQLGQQQGGVPPLAPQQAALQFQQQQLQQLSGAGGASSALHSASPPIVQLQHLQQQLQPPPPYLTQPVTPQQLQQLQVNQQLQVTHQLRLQQLQQQQQELQLQQARAMIAGTMPPPQLQQSSAVPDGLPPPLSTPPMFADGQQLQPLPPPPPPPGHALPIMQTQQQFQVPPPQSQLSTVSHIGAGGAQGLVQSQTPQVVVGTAPPSLGAAGGVAPGGAVGLGQSQISVGALPPPTAGPSDPNGLVGALQQRQRQTLGGQFAGDVAGVAGLSVPQVPAPLTQGPVSQLPPPPPFSAAAAGLPPPPPMLGVDAATGISVGGAGGGVRQIHSGEESDGVTPGEVKPGTQLLVNYVADTVTVAELRRLFDPFGPIELVRVIHDKSTGRRKGYGFVYYFNAADAKAAAAAMSGLPLQGKRLKVAVAQDERPVPTSVSALAPPLPMTR